VERALAFYHWRKELDVFDNMKTVVKERTKTATVFNQRFVDCARFRGSPIAPQSRPSEQVFSPGSKVSQEQVD
jgi:transposase